MEPCFFFGFRFRFGLTGSTVWRLVDEDVGPFRVRLLFFIRKGFCFLGVSFLVSHIPHSCFTFLETPLLRGTFSSKHSQLLGVRSFFSRLDFRAFGSRTPDLESFFFCVV